MGSAETTRPMAEGAATSGVQLRGRSIGRYLVLERLGEGGVGEVFAAYDPHLDRRVALKLLRSGERTATATGPSEHDWRKLLAEAQALARLSDPHVVVVHDVGVFEGRTFLAMELVDGVDLAKWLHRERRPWREVLQVLRDAGAGLAAAHAAGVVHRDFKPANVLVGEGPAGRRVKVGDFGLARRHGDDGNTAPASALLAPAETGTTAAEDGGLPPGTPFYMAPELFDGEPASVRSDIYAYCVAMYEALVGQRPHQATTIAGLVAAKHEAMPAIPAEVGLPRWLIAAIERGLAVDPDQRFADMPTLLAALDRDRTRRGRTAIVVGLAAVGTAVAWAVAGGPAQCTGARRHVDGVWDDARAATVTRIVEDSALPYAAATIADVTTTLDDWTSRWVQTHQEVCERSRHGEQSSAALDARMICLDDARARLASVLDVVEQGAPTALERASTAVHGLPDPESCAVSTPSTLAPSDPQLRAVLARSEAALQLGDATGAETAARDLLARAERIDDRRIALEAGMLLGHAETALQRHDAAERTLTATIFGAQAVDASDLQVRLAVALASLLASHTHRFDEADRWLDYAEAELAHDPELEGQRGRVVATRAGVDVARGDIAAAIEGFERAHAWDLEHDADPLQQAITIGYFGVALRNGGRFADAVEKHEQALALRTAVLGPDHPLVGLSLGQLGRSLSDAGRRTEAAVMLGRALALRERVWGPDHVDVADTLIDIASNQQGLGLYAEAEATSRRVLVILERAYGSDHQEVIGALVDLGRAQDGQGRFEEASTTFERALTIARRIGEGPPEIATLELDLGIMRMQQGRLDDAERLMRAAIEAFEGEAAVNGYEIASAAASLGEVLQRRERWDEAAEQYAKSITVFERTMPSDHPDMAGPLRGLGMCRMHAGRRTEAIAAFERALALVTGPDADPSDRARAQLNLAEALAAADPDRARTLVDAVRSFARTPGPDSQTLLARCDALRL